MSVKKPDKKQLARIFKRARKIREEIIEEEDRKSDEEITVEGICMVCGGKLVGKFKSVHDPMTGPIIIGPGSREQFNRIQDGYHCTKCGLKYEFPPPKRVKKS